ncbi:MAG TPA: hypothetical protein VG737_03940, partial [Cyclobacteriaceae bacterium]|nr:hypothetical protein [Cyclobacteriaceae bacterium]
MKRGLFIVFLFAALQSPAQKEGLKPTSSFTISGEVKAPVTIKIADLKKWTITNIGDVVITN